jgi:hypothetical protein
MEELMCAYHSDNEEFSSIFDDHAVHTICHCLMYVVHFDACNCALGYIYRLPHFPAFCHPAFKGPALEHQRS